MIRCCIRLRECKPPMDAWHNMRDRIRKRRRMNVVVIYPVPEALETSDFPVQEAVVSRDIMDAIEVV